jgi:hypothetical protein
MRDKDWKRRDDIRRAANWIAALEQRFSLNLPIGIN